MAEQQARRRSGREGARWFNDRPSAEELASWFRDNVMLHEGLTHDSYLGGLTLIQSKEKSNEVIGYRDNGAPIIDERQNLVYTPYPRVDMRVRYWHDFLRENEDQYLGVVEPIEPVDGPVAGLPPGFFLFSVQAGENAVARYICCSMKATVFLRSTVETKPVVIDKRTGRTKLVRTGQTVIDAPPATKMIPLVGRYGADPMSLMKAETGAVGRALGLAGMLVVPGAGAATAEDLHEMQQMESGEPQPGTTALPANTATSSQDGRSQEEKDAALREQAAKLIAQLKEADEQGFKDFQEWCRTRSIGRLSETTSPALKGVVKALEKKLDSLAQKKAAPDADESAEVEAAKADAEPEAEPAAGAGSS